MVILQAIRKPTVPCKAGSGLSFSLVLSPSLSTVQSLRGPAARAVTVNHQTISPHAAFYLAPHEQEPEV